MIRFATRARFDISKIDKRLSPRAGVIVTGRVIETILASIARLDKITLRERPRRRAGVRELMITRYPDIVIYRLVGRRVTIPVAEGFA